MNRTIARFIIVVALMPLLLFAMDSKVATVLGLFFSIALELTAVVWSVMYLLFLSDTNHD